MNKEITKLQKRKQNLLKAIEFIKQKNKDVLKIIHTLISQFESGQISRIKYETKKIYKSNRGRIKWI